MPRRELYHSPLQIAQGREKKMENYSQVEIRMFTEAQCSLYQSRLNRIVKTDIQWFSSKVSSPQRNNIKITFYIVERQERKQKMPEYSFKHDIVLYLSPNPIILYEVRTLNELFAVLKGKNGNRFQNAPSDLLQVPTPHATPT